MIYRNGFLLPANDDIRFVVTDDRELFVRDSTSDKKWGTVGEAFDTEEEGKELPDALCWFFDTEKHKAPSRRLYKDGTYYKVTLRENIVSVMKKVCRYFATGNNYKRLHGMRMRREKGIEKARRLSHGR